ncbi:4a-hydroxytetrahydrobiopterin dehydratase [Massilia sp.]|uniref:4a-hydroxytetrahydrobiopterin dehydratase n=1 Tax=Massilia sp. TaxID=1882437 RepID=UPI0028A9C5F8|nr:4a-hydroxytetrahydrobiopterin dehydratase [Massilia sp.]
MRLADQHCVHGAPALNDNELAARLAALPDWQLKGNHIEREYAFKDYRETIAFVNALASMIHGEDHHPELRVRYRHCLVAWTTHSAGNAVSINDFICAAKADAIYEERSA